MQSSLWILKIKGQMPFFFVPIIIVVSEEPIKNKEDPPAMQNQLFTTNM